MAVSNFTGAIAWAVSLAAGVSATSAAAQSMALPAEFPPASYTASQYVDSKGCAFVRAGMDGAVNWVPRVDRARNQLCNFKPTVTRAAEVIPRAQPNVPVITVKARPASVTAAAAAPVAKPVAARPAAPRRVAAPMPVAAAAPTPRVVTAPEPRRISFAEACEGRFGVQKGFVSARTRQPIDCGAAPQVAATPVAAPAPLRMTLAAACARQAETGERLISAATGAPIVCVAAPVQIAQAATVADAPMAQTAMGQACGIPGFASNGRQPVRCGPQSESPSGRQVTRRATNPAVASVSRHSTQVAALARGVPASNVIGATARGARMPKGYEQVWTDGRINPQRGLAKPQVAVAVSTSTVPPARVQAPATAGGQRYVQVGSFGDPANAARLIARLQAAGLPVASAKSGGIKVIAAGPFRSAADLQRALGLVRGMGFADAFARG